MQPQQPVVTGEAVVLEMRTAGVASRGLGAAIDLAIVVIALIPLLAIVGAIASSADSATAIALSIVLTVGVFLGYPVGSETLWRGRTVGKAVMGLRVVRDDGGPIRFRHALVRGLLGVFLERPGPILGAPAVLFILITRNEKRIGDLFAGTVVLRDRVPGTTPSVLQVPPPLAGWAATLDLSAVDDGLAARVRSFLARADSLAQASRAQFEVGLTDELTTRVGQPPEGTPGWAFLTAVVAERSHRAVRASAPPAAAPPYSPATSTPPPTPALRLTPQPPADLPREQPASGAGFAPPG